VDAEPRTCGVLYAASSMAEVAALPYEALAPLAYHNPAATAAGKVAAIVGREVQVFQVQPGRRAACAWCGNAIAAAAQNLGRNHITFSALGPGGARAEVEALVAGFQVHQAWTMPPARARDVSAWGMQAAMIAALNDYAIVLGPLPAPEEADLLRQRLAGKSVAAKLVVVTPAEAAPLVTFYNANGRHGAAPLTGLATLALATRDLPWLRAAIGDGHVIYETRAGLRLEPLPLIDEVAGGRVQFSLPPVSVQTLRIPNTEEFQ
jgi:hypothetical protein